MSSNAMATRNAGGLANVPIGGTNWAVMWEQAQVLVKSGFLPGAVKTAEQAIAIVLTGDELGLPPMLALRSIHVIDGKPTLSADLMASLVQREIDRHGDGLLMVLPPTPEACTVKYRRWGWGEEQAYTYTIEAAQRANLAGRATWKAHPAAMLRARATSAVCRMAFPDVIAGLFTDDEAEDAAPEPRVRANVKVLTPEAIAASREASGAALPAGEAATGDPEQAAPVVGDVVDRETGEITGPRYPEMDKRAVFKAIRDLGKAEFGWASAGDATLEAAHRGLDIADDGDAREFLHLLHEAVRERDEVPVAEADWQDLTDEEVRD